MKRVLALILLAELDGALLLFGPRGTIDAIVVMLACCAVFGTVVALGEAMLDAPRGRL